MCRKPVYFFPVGVETLGPWGSSAKALLNAIGKSICENTGEKRATEYLQQRVSMDIQRGNYSAVMGTIQPTKNLDEVFYLL